jgi:hypothetical protein
MEMVRDGRADLFFAGNVTANFAGGWPFNSTFVIH